MKDPDRDLITKAKNGSVRAFGKLIQKYHREILYLAYDLLGNYEDAKDLAQEAFLRCYEKLGGFEERSRFSTWLFRITINLGIDFHRRNNRTPLQSIEENLQKKYHRSFAEHPTTILSPQLLVERKELKQHMELALDKLSMNQRTVVVLKYFHQKSTKEISEILKCQEGTVRIHTFRAMNNLKKHLSLFK